MRLEAFLASIRGSTRGRMGRVFAMTVKFLGAGGTSDDPIGIVADPLEEARPEVSDASDMSDLSKSCEMDEGELLEFLAADLDPVEADPVFMQELGDRLWEMVRSGRLPRPPRH